MKPITKSRESIREGILYWQKTGKMPEISDGAADIFAKMIYIFDKNQTLRNHRVTILQKIEKKRKGRAKLDDEESVDMFIEISVRRQVIDDLVNDFSPITYQQACKDYQFACEVFNMNILESAALNLNVAEEECFDSYRTCMDKGDFLNAGKFMDMYIKIQANKPKTPPKFEPRPTKIIASFSPHLIKGCEVIESQEEIDLLESELIAQYSTVKQTASSLLQKYATDIESEIVQDDDRG